MGAYLDLLRMPSVLRVTAWQLFARLPQGMLSLSILLHVHAKSGSYALGGTVVAGVCIGEAIAMPVTARLTGRFGVMPVLLSASAVNAAAMVALAFAPANVALLALFGTLAGASVPPVMPVVRALYPEMVPGDVVGALFALDTSAQELIWVIGPVAATLLATGMTTEVPLVVMAVITVSGTVGFLTNLKRRPPRIVRNTSSFGRVLLQREVILAMFASLALVSSFMALEVGVLADLGGNGVVAGAAIALSSVGSLVGGIVFGHRKLGMVGLLGMLAVVTVGTALTGVVDGRVLQFCALFAAGVGFAPALSTLYLMVSRGVEEHLATETFGWLNTGALAGAAIGTAVGGAMTDAFGPTGAYGAGTIIALLAGISPLVARATGKIGALTN
ncbi:MFS transporter [Mycobacterium sp. URHB0021]